MATEPLPCKHEEWTTRKAMLYFRDENEVDFKVGKEFSLKFTPENFLGQQIQFMLGPKPSPIFSYILAIFSFLFVLLSGLLWYASIKFSPGGFKLIRIWVALLIPTASAVYFLYLTKYEARKHKTALTNWYEKPTSEDWHLKAICKKCGHEWNLSSGD